jgi:hypothetical protein
VASVFSKRGRAALILSNAAGNTAGGIGAGASTGKLVGKATAVRPGVWLGGKLSGGARYVYVLRNNKVRAAGVASAADVKHPAQLRADLHAAHL